ncbi:MAG: hypothetical protein EPN21_16950 [Methylococcaceae bacterium]|nr:MAG: hypothetical protein EPN21_16950 [Methylococcaceae bacterium]
MAPGLTIAASQARFKAGETAVVTFTFSELPKGFSAEDVSVGGGKLSGLAASPDDGKVYTAVYTPAGVNKLKGSIGVDAATYTDAAGNAGAAGNTLTPTGDTLAPNLAISGKTLLRPNEAAQITFSFSESPGDFTFQDITVIGGRLSDLAVGLNDDKVYTALFTPLFKTIDRTGYVKVAAGAYSDAAGNLGTAGNVLALKVDNRSPSLAISSDQASLKAGETAALTFRFSELPSGFTAEDITVAGGSLSGLAADAGDGKVYTALYIPSADTNGWSDAITVAAGTYADAAGNPGGGNTLSLSGDTLAPSLVIAGDQTRLKAGEMAAVTFTFSEIPSGFSAEDISVAGGALSGLAADPGDGSIYTATYTPTVTATLAGSIAVAAGNYSDAAGNAGGAGNTVSLSGDTLAPTVTITSPHYDLNLGENPYGHLHLQRGAHRFHRRRSQRNRRHRGWPDGQSRRRDCLHRHILHP